VFIADEIQTGVGRTGKMFAIEHASVVPDLIVMAKSLAGGFPLSAIVGRADIMDVVGPGGLGGTYGGSPIGCAAALAVLDAMEEQHLLQRALRVGERLKSRLQALAQRTWQIGEVRGLGAMVAIELFQDRERRRPDADLAKQVIANAAQLGLILLSCGTYANVIRILVPLTASDALLDEGLDLLEASIAQSVAPLASAA
jgi:4-aminobutyrate aminotransferase / (S)-3-amino-2-methylpropionate transaminase / 5-aminovalerate transaminase